MSDQAVAFLEWLRPGGPWSLTAIVPDGASETITARGADEARKFIARHNGRRNVYYAPNPVRAAMGKKAKKTDVCAIEFLIADLDPENGEAPEDAKERYLRALAGEPEASALVDSGNGIQGLWRLQPRIDLPPLAAGKLSPEASAAIADAEARSKAIMERAGATAGTQNIDRILRLPGTTNLPNAKKRRAGRAPCEARLIAANGAAHAPDAFPVARGEAGTPPEGAAPEDLDWSEVARHASWLRNSADLPRDFNAKGRMIVDHAGNLPDLNVELREAGLVEKPYGSWSDVSMALAAIFKADGRFTSEQIAAALMCELECNRHVTKESDEAKKRRAVARALTRSYDRARVARMVNWRECTPRGLPRPTMHNARVAITAAGVECSHDTFHKKFLFGNRGDEVRHELQPILGEVSDDGIIRLRQLLSDQFGVDFGDKATRDAVKSLSLEHCFDPVRDMLDRAEAEWDGTERLDRMAVDHFQCDDTPLNRAIVRKMMIAAVRRARCPGVKFDNIVVLESPEGWNKSTAFRVLAGDENFSDMSIIGQGGREVQEHLSEIWIHENAELAGMRKAEVEIVKSFASRQVDIARPAYGYFLLKQKRHSIEVGSTNSDEYLQSQTGNRRFWPLAVRRSIDIDALRRDRLQLWGEAARCETAGESITLDEALWGEAAAQQERRRTRDPWEDTVANIPFEVVLDEYGRPVESIWERGDPPSEGVEDGGNRNYHASTIQIIHEEGGQDRVRSSDILNYVLEV